MVFDVRWLIKDSRRWLKREIRKIADNDVIEHQSQLFVFEESLYIFSKWKDSEMMNTLILELRFKEGTHLFISRYMEDLESLEIYQLHFLLLLGGSNTSVFLEAVIRHLRNKCEKTLDKNTRYLLLNMNLTLCFQTCEDLTYDLFEILSELDDTDDTRCMFKLMAAATREALRESKRLSGPRELSALFDLQVWNELYSRFSTLDDILDYYVVKINVVSVYTVIDLLGKITYFHPPDAETSEKFVKKLISCCNDSNLVRRASKRYVDQIVGAIKYSYKDTKGQIIHLLELIKESSRLSSDFEILQLEGVELTEQRAESENPFTPEEPAAHSPSVLLKKLLPTFKKKPQQMPHSPQGLSEYEKNFLLNELYFKVEFSHRGILNCSARCNGGCGFIIKHCVKGIEFSLELCEDEDLYQDSDLHFNKQLDVENMHWYMVMSVKVQDATRATELETRGGTGATEMETQGGTGATEMETRGGTGAAEMETRGGTGATEMEAHGGTGATELETLSGKRAQVPISRLGWWWRMWLLGSGEGWRLEKECVVDYNISSHLVAK